ncbi:hypothetical protein J0Q64_001597 [Salmonella enterica subsp. enterica serovar Newport]|nr:hypothetical protein [Salmonella enterica]ECG8519675.1 hypothetical protein [Salmonella enterica subsp. diarizonae]EHE7037543.1 hypothetical protein [Salmonella enterica subsp. enterica serovar Newport]EKR1705906.1 hypothetical protein [Salmonella enterica subsp. enterica serovar Carrau]EBF2149638.1 hypothetical protein [Salmonella enterica]
MGKNTSTAALRHLQMAQLIGYSGGVNYPGEDIHEPVNRAERRAQAALARKSKANRRHKHA